MKFSDVFGELEEWFWKLEFNPETNSYELFMGIPNDWKYSGNGKDVNIDLVHEMELNSMIKISSPDESYTIDDIIEVAKLLVQKNKELEKRKEEHRKEMEQLAKMLIEKEKNFLEYIDTVTDTKGTGIKEDEKEEEVVVEVEEEKTEGTSEGETEGINPEKVNNFMEDLHK
jgi:ABC-type Fe3+-citrate transport system substrate-binding protein